MMTCDVTFVQLQPGLRETEMAPLTEKMTFNRFQLEENHLAPGLKLGREDALGWRAGMFPWCGSRHMWAVSTLKLFKMGGSHVVICG